MHPIELSCRVPHAYGPGRESAGIVFPCLVRRGRVDTGTEGEAAAIAVAMTSVATLLPPAEGGVRPHPRRGTARLPHFARIVLARIHILVRHLGKSLRLSQDHRPWRRLADLADTKRVQTTSDGPAVLLDRSQSEPAEIIGLSRQKLSRRPKRLEEEGWVELAPRRIRVLDPGGLRATAAGSLARER